MKLTLIRGLPGSGKSTLAKSMDAKHFEADMFFINESGEYKFDRSKIKDAHNWCKNMTAHYMSMGFDIVVSNTFTQMWEMEDYKKLAKKNGYEIEIIVAKGNFKNIHGVPQEEIQRMSDRWED